MDRLKKILILLFYFFGLSLSLPLAAAANIEEVFGLSPKAISMGNAISAVADDFSASFHNPAGLGQHDTHQLSFVYAFCQPELKQSLASAPGRINAREDKHFRSLIVGTVFDLSRAFNTRGHNLTLGMALAAGDNFKNSWRVHNLNPEVPQFSHYGDYMNRLHCYTALGLALFKDKVYIGGGFNLTQDFGCKVDVTVDVTQEAPLREEFSIDADAEISPLAGILVKPFAWLSLAYTYRDAWELKMPTEFTVDLALAGTSLVPPLSSLVISMPVTDYYRPWNMTAGLAISPVESLTVAIDVTFYRWSNFTEPMWEAHPDWKNELKEWEDTILPRVGVEYGLLKNLQLRAGYYYEQSPVPDQSNVKSNYLDFDKHVLSCGLGYTFLELPFIGSLPVNYPIGLDAFFQYHLLGERTEKKLAQTGQEGWKIEGTQFALGAGLTVRF